MRGTPFLYNGEEIGMADVPIPPEESIDPPAARVSRDFRWWDRSQSRTPLPWSAGPGAGFTTGRPWLRLGPDASTRNVAAQRRDPDSVLACYQRLLAARREQASLRDGSLELVTVGDRTVLAYRRRGSGPEILVVVAFDRRGAEVRLPRPEAGGGWRAVAGTHRDPPRPVESPGRLALRPFEGLVLAAES
jgi:alpha-glucosidase